MNRFSQFFVNALTASQKPHLWQESDTDGRTQWHTYDPLLNEHRQHDSEDAARAWFEQHSTVRPARSAASRLYWETAFDGVR